MDENTGKLRPIHFFSSSLSPSQIRAKAGINKRATTPYHPQCDGMSERNIELVKQVIQCLQLDRQLPKGSCPGLLAEVSFHINNMENATSRVSPHLLHLGREPLSPLNSWCKHLQEGERNTHGEYLEAIEKKQLELQNIAQENISRNLDRARLCYNQGKQENDITKGDSVMLKQRNLRDSLSPRFAGPFYVIQRRRPDVKL